MLIDIQVTGKKVLVVGGGEVGERKVLALIREGAHVTVASKTFTEQLVKLGRTDKLILKKLGKNVSSRVLRSLPESDLVIAATDDEQMNKMLAEKARRAKIPICVVDNPKICDFYFPATTDFGNLKIAVSTGGRSPAMASTLRRRLEKAITNEDILQVELQNYARNLMRAEDMNIQLRKKILYGIIKNRRVSSLLRRGRLEEAERIVGEIIESA
jgi:precorrin-2 dehydrogenase/sirohydrochlorin ferrochelatase